MTFPVTLVFLFYPVLMYIYIFHRMTCFDNRGQGLSMNLFRVIWTGTGATRTQTLSPTSLRRAWMSQLTRRYELC